MNATDLHDLETWYAASLSPSCEASVDRTAEGAPGHACTVTARWVAHDGHGRTRLWCDARYQVWLAGVASGNVCHCERRTTHWTVVPL